LQKLKALVIDIFIFLMVVKYISFARQIFSSVFTPSNQLWRVCKKKTDRKKYSYCKRKLISNLLRKWSYLKNPQKLITFRTTQTFQLINIEAYLVIKTNQKKHLLKMLTFTSQKFCLFCALSAIHINFLLNGVASIWSLITSS